MMSKGGAVTADERIPPQVENPFVSGTQIAMVPAFCTSSRHSARRDDNDEAGS